MSSGSIDAEALAGFAAARGLDWICRETTASTNADVLQHFDRERREVVAVSGAQTAGRGRRGRDWHSPPGRNIYCTLGLLKSVPPNRQALVGIATGVALCRSLRASSGAEVQLKWPNDLLLRGAKLGGILTESRAHGEQFFFAIGFGLNLALDDADHDVIGQPAASLELAAGGPVERDPLLMALLDAVLADVRGLDAADEAGLAREFARFDAFHGREVEVVDGAGRRVRGIDRGIAGDGQLRLETGDGLESFSAAEISLRAPAA